MEDAEKSGYDKWILLWTIIGHAPTLSDCPARYMKQDDPNRSAFIRGWRKADQEFRGIE